MSGLKGQRNNGQDIVDSMNNSVEQLKTYINDIAIKTDGIRNFINAMEEDKDKIAEAINMVSSIEIFESADKINETIQGQKSSVVEVSLLAEELKKLSNELYQELNWLKLKYYSIM